MSCRFCRRSQTWGQQARRAPAVQGRRPTLHCLKGLTPGSLSSSRVAGPPYQSNREQKTGMDVEDGMQLAVAEGWGTGGSDGSKRTTRVIAQLWNSSSDSVRWCHRISAKWQGRMPQSVVWVGFGLGWEAERWVPFLLRWLVWKKQRAGLARTRGQAAQAPRERLERGIVVATLNRKDRTVSREGVELGGLGGAALHAGCEQLSSINWLPARPGSRAFCGMPRCCRHRRSLGARQELRGRDKLLALAGLAGLGARLAAVGAALVLIQLPAHGGLGQHLGLVADIHVAHRALRWGVLGCVWGGRRAARSACCACDLRPGGARAEPHRAARSAAHLEPLARRHHPGNHGQQDGASQHHARVVEVPGMKGRQGRGMMQELPPAAPASLLEHMSRRPPGLHSTAQHCS